MQILLRAAAIRNDQLVFEILSGIVDKYRRPEWNAWVERANQDDIDNLDKILEEFDAKDNFSGVIFRMVKEGKPAGGLGFILPILDRIKDLLGDSKTREVKDLRLVYALCMMIGHSWRVDPGEESTTGAAATVVSSSTEA
jgi:hypothetical protein